MSVQKKQYENLNALKIIAAFFVVAIHVHFPGDFGRAFVAVARFAVPFFFMVSGFFSYYEDKSVLREKYRRKIKHVAVLFLSGLILYFLFGSAVAFVNDAFGEYVTELFSAENILSFVLFNSVSVSDFFWFLPALIYVYVAFFLTEKTGKTEKLYFLIPVLFVAGVVLREIPEFIENVPEIFNKPYLCRNWLFIGLPFFMLGHWIRANEDKLKKKLSDLSLVLIMLLSTAEAVAADMLHIQKAVYIGTFFAASALFVFALGKEGNVKTGMLAFLGAEYSLYVYILHIMVKNVFEKLFSIGIFAFAGEVTAPVMPVVVFAVTLVASAVYVYVKKFLKSKFGRER